MPTVKDFIKSKPTSLILKKLNVRSTSLGLCLSGYESRGRMEFDNQFWDRVRKKFGR